MVEELTLEQQDVAQACRVLEVIRSGYYDWLGRPLSVRIIEDECLWQKIKKHWETSRKTYGRLKIKKRHKDELNDICEGMSIHQFKCFA